jgi:hypothetical protein
MESDFFSLSALAKAIETRDSAAMRGFYAENARMRIIDRDHPPSRPQEIVGRAAIAAYFDDVCGRTMTHKVENGCVAGDRLAFTQACSYPNGMRVFCSAMAELNAGQIATQTIVQAWDA